MLGGKIMLYQSDSVSSDRVSSLYISELTHKKHNVILRDIRHVIGLPFVVQSTRRNVQNRRFPVYFLTKPQFLELMQSYVANLHDNSRFISKLKNKVIAENYEYLENSK